MHQSSTSFSPSSPLHLTPAQGRSAATSSVVMPGSRTYVPYDDGGLDPAAQSLSRLHEWVGLLDRYLRLPNTFQAFSLYLIGLALVFGGATLHVMVAAQIMQAEHELAMLQRERVAIEQENSEYTFILARDTNLQRIYDQAVAMGYEPVTEREFVSASPATDLAEQPAQTAPTAVDPTQPVATQADASPLRQWELFLRGEIPWRQPVASLRTAPSITERKTASSEVGWPTRWQQLLEQGRQLFTTANLR